MRIPTRRLRPIISEWRRAGGVINSGRLRRLIHRIEHEQDWVNFNTADRLLCELGREDHWHGELADLCDVLDQLANARARAEALRLRLRDVEESRDRWKQEARDWKWQALRRAA